LLFSRRNFIVYFTDKRNNKNHRQEIKMSVRTLEFIKTIETKKKYVIGRSKIKTRIKTLSKLFSRWKKSSPHSNESKNKIPISTNKFLISLLIKISFFVLNFKGVQNVKLN